MIVADDERWIRERIALSINWAKAGVRVTGEAADGEEALLLSRDLKPDIIITDIRMPGLSGLDFIKQLKKTGIRTKIIIISGYSDFNYAQKAIKLGVTDYILKPVENSELLNIVKKCVRQIEAENVRNHIIEQAAFQKKLSEKLAGYEEGTGANARNTIGKAIAFIENNYSRPISLEDTAAEVMLNPSYLSKLFRETVGLPYSKYLTIYRINKAKELMIDPTRRIKEISRLVGYENVQYFIRVFKSLTGLSPNVYKEQL